MKNFAAVVVTAALISASVPLAHAGTVTISGFSTPARTQQVLDATAGSVFNKHVGSIKARCGLRTVHVNQRQPLAQVIPALSKICPGSLVVTLRTPSAKARKTAEIAATDLGLAENLF